MYIGSRRSHIQNCLGTPRIWIYHRFFILRSYSQNLGTDFQWTIGSSSSFFVINTAAAAATTTTIRFSEFSLGRKMCVVRCKGDSKSRWICTTSLWFEIGALHQICFFFYISYWYSTGNDIDRQFIKNLWMHRTAFSKFLANNGRTRHTRDGHRSTSRIFIARTHYRACYSYPNSRHAWRVFRFSCQSRTSAGFTAATATATTTRCCCICQWSITFWVRK